MKCVPKHPEIPLIDFEQTLDFHSAQLLKVDLDQFVLTEIFCLVGVSVLVWQIGIKLHQGLEAALFPVEGLELEDVMEVDLAGAAEGGGRAPVGVQGGVAVNDYCAFWLIF